MSITAAPLHKSKALVRYPPSLNTAMKSQYLLNKQ